LKWHTQRRFDRFDSHCSLVVFLCFAPGPLLGLHGPHLPKLRPSSAAASGNKPDLSSRHGRTDSDCPTHTESDPICALAVGSLVPSTASSNLGGPLAPGRWLRTRPRSESLARHGSGLVGPTSRRGRVGSRAGSRVDPPPGSRPERSAGGHGTPGRLSGRASAGPLRGGHCHCGHCGAA
jgi:hypothetical protein